jgi:ankyrin repeat protein
MQDGRTALSDASSEGHQAIVTLLLEAGADMKTEDSMLLRGHPYPFGGRDFWYCGSNALIEASWMGHTAVVKLLLKAGANVDAKSEVRLVRVSFSRSPVRAFVIRMNYCIYPFVYAANLYT